LTITTITPLIDGAVTGCDRGPVTAISSSIALTRSTRPPLNKSTLLAAVRTTRAAPLIRREDDRCRSGGGWHGCAARRASDRYQVKV